jgi:hypothetical protein
MFTGIHHGHYPESIVSHLPTLFPKDPFKYWPPIYACIFWVVSSLQVFWPKFCVSHLFRAHLIPLLSYPPPWNLSCNDLSHYIPIFLQYLIDVEYLICSWFVTSKSTHATNIFSHFDGEFMMASQVTVVFMVVQWQRGNFHFKLRVHYVLNLDRECNRQYQEFRRLHCVLFLFMYYITKCMVTHPCFKHCSDMNWMRIHIKHKSESCTVCTVFSMHYPCLWKPTFCVLIEKGIVLLNSVTCSLHIVHQLLWVGKPPRIFSPWLCRQINMGRLHIVVKYVWKDSSCGFLRCDTM